MDKLWFLEQGFQTLHILAPVHWHSEEMHHDLGSKTSNSICCPSFVFQFSDLLAHIHILTCTNDSLANASAKSSSKTRQGLDWCLHNSFRFSWGVSFAGFAYSCVCNAWQEAMLSVLREPVFWCFSLCWPVLFFEREIKIGLRQNWTDEPLPSRNEYATCLICCTFCARLDFRLSRNMDQLFHA